MELIIKLLQNILQNLPLIAEEGEYKGKISRDELSKVMKEQTLASHDAINVVLEMVELQWTKAGLLEPFELKLGNWQITHSPFCYHFSSNLSCLFYIVSSPGCHLVKNEHFSTSPAHENG